jgi:Ca-activated chloride channel family protein
MGFLAPVALFFSALALPIVILYMLKLRRQPVVISSVFLWQQVLRDRQANAPWQRLRRNLLLLLQLLLLALLVFALARPYLTVQASVQGHVVLLLDASASMKATDVAPSRFDVARSAARDLVDRLRPEDSVTVIAVAQTPRLLAPATTDRAALHRALDAARPTNSIADWEDALALAAAGMPGATVVVVSDGALPPDLPPLPVPVQFIGVGAGSDNRGIVALALRDGRQGPELFLRVANFAAEPASALVEISVDGRLFDARRLDLPASGQAGLTLGDLPLDARIVQARLSGAPDDALSADDAAWAIRASAPARLLLVTEGNVFLERALGLLPGVKAVRANPGGSLPAARFDLTVFDAALPDEALPPGNLLFIAPPRSCELFEVGGVVTATRVTRVAGDDPLLRYTDFSALRVARAVRIKPPPWARVLVEAEGGPLVMAGTTGGRRVAIIAFDLHQSDLPLQINFPILTANLVRWLLAMPTAAGMESVHPGEAILLPTQPEAQTMAVETPAGRRLSLPIGGGPVYFADSDELGVYAVRYGAGDSAPAGYFAVNLLDEAESDITPGQGRISGREEAGAARTSPYGQLEFWRLPALLAFAVLLLEWWVYWRGAWL